ncbi:LysM peptidoglycan-binding domain-containing protein [Sinanaerobacter sp. ZZT-01]|uniref:LysM peptidoglycan-binding domain-containing protein n=1 Tax=Sinanaerobacter sp. ZZT-01 TaxID=3111540 RepID=UPI002D7782E7|nr:LysM peptidoglycan-binding domain-containing protein [Sinanaerobacter sp. ZZT-01]WRR93112.1 LysM peptidoglycan-binding domain-containing protein [Sinanaerobacter sp. ZZT-01]
MQEYIIQPNDTLFYIAKKFGIPLVQLINANPELANPNLIYIGQVIKIPDLFRIPEQFDTIEENAVGVIDDIYLGDWAKAIGKVEIIQKAMNDAMTYLQEAYVPNQLISSMNTAIRSLDQNVMQKRTYPAISQANQVTRFLADMLDYYEVIIPPDIKRLSYLGRQMIINIESNDWNEANNNYMTAKRYWERLKPELDEKYNDNIVEFDMLLNDLGESIKNKNYEMTIENIVAMLDGIQMLENDFAEQRQNEMAAE